MICRLLALSLCLLIVEACVPVRPGEDFDCADPPYATEADGYNIVNPTEKPMEDGSRVFGCVAPQMLLLVDGTAPTELTGTAAKIKCKPYTGQWVDGDSKPIGNKKVTCGTPKLPCQKCNQAQLFDPMHATCSQPSIFCMSKPKITTDPATCSMISCDAPNDLFVLTAATSAKVTASTVVCDASGVWKYGTMDLGNAEGFACGIEAQCRDCNADLMPLFTSPGSPTFFDISPAMPYEKPSCAYECPDGRISTNGATYSSLECDMLTRKVTVTPSGADYDKTKTFTCSACMCSNGDFKEGAGLCDPFTEVCTSPAGNMCDGFCLPGYTARYLDATSNMPKDATREFSCLGNKWIDANMDTAAGVTCQRSQTDTYPTTPEPECTKLGVYTCPNPANCDATQVVYLETATGFKAVCKQGSLVTDTSTIFESALCDGGVWQGNPAPTEASCDTSTDALQGCEGFLTIPLTDLILGCQFGVCTVQCAAPGKKIDYVANVSGNLVPRRDEYLRCISGEPFGPDEATIPNPGAATCT